MCHRADRGREEGDKIKSRWEIKPKLVTCVEAMSYSGVAAAGGGSALLFGPDRMGLEKGRQRRRQIGSF